MKINILIGLLSDPVLVLLMCIKFGMKSILIGLRDVLQFKNTLSIASSSIHAAPVLCKCCALCVYALRAPDCSVCTQGAQ